MVAAVDLILAQLDERRLTVPVTPEALASLIAGLGHLMYLLAADLVGDDREAIKTLLLGLQMRQRLMSIFGDPGGNAPPG